MTQAQVQVVRSESPWVTAVLLAFSFVLMSSVLSLPLSVRTFLFQPFSTPAGSMAPTLLIGDNFFVSKYAYGYSRYTWPFMPPSSGRIWGSEPARGDVVAFYLPKDHSTVYIKRVVGLPRDSIQMKQGLLHINSVPVVRERLPDFVGNDPCGSYALTRTRRWRETLPNGVSHENSSDSRVLAQIGYVPLENIIGRAGMIYFSVGSDGAGAESKFRAERLGLMIR
jgi:signal peptidase I